MNDFTSINVMILKHDQGNISVSKTSVLRSDTSEIQTYNRIS